MTHLHRVPNHCLLYPSKAIGQVRTTIFVRWYIHSRSWPFLVGLGVEDSSWTHQGFFFLWASESTPGAFSCYTACNDSQKAFSFNLISYLWKRRVWKFYNSSTSFLKSWLQAFFRLIFLLLCSSIVEGRSFERFRSSISPFLCLSFFFSLFL